MDSSKHRLSRHSLSEHKLSRHRLSEHGLSEHRLSERRLSGQESSGQEPSDQAGLPEDVVAITARARDLASHANLFDLSRPLTVTRAPGRLDVMGGIADYSGSHVLEYPLACATVCVGQTRHDGRLIVVSESDRGTRRFERSAIGEVLEHDATGLRSYLRSSGEHGDESWAAYVLGSFGLGDRAFRSGLSKGVSLFVSPAVPEGKGVSSSAALEVATASCLYALAGHPLEGIALAAHCQRIENLVAGAPCGIMDQLTSVCGRAGALLLLRCQPSEVLGHVTIGSGLDVWGIDSGVRHEVGGGDYGSVRTAAFMGHRIVSALEGRRTSWASVEGSPRLTVLDDPLGGYLARIPLDRFLRRHFAALPLRLSGRAFLEKYGGTIDPATEVDPDRTYGVRQATLHPIAENARVERFAALLAHAPRAPVARELGQLMFASHASYGRLGLGSTATDLLVELCREAGPRAGIFGARITGGGNGGTVAILGRADAGDSVARIAERYSARTGRASQVFHGSSSGQAALGAVTIAPHVS